MEQSYIVAFAPDVVAASVTIGGPVGDVIRKGISAQMSASSHDHSHDHGGYEHHCEH